MRRTPNRGRLFIAELGLNLIHRQWHLPIAVDLVRDQVGDRLFVRGPQGHVDAAALPLDLQLDEHVAEGVDAAALLEQADGRERRHEDFHRPGGVHAAADDLLGLLQRPQAQRQIGIGPGHHLVDQPRAEHEDMAGNLRPFGRFFHGGNERAGPVHGTVKDWVAVHADHWVMVTRSESEADGAKLDGLGGPSYGKRRIVGQRQRR